MSEVPVGEIVFASQPTLGSVIELLERSPLTILEETGLPREGIEGKVDAKVKIGLPLLADLPASSVKVEAKAQDHRRPHQEVPRHLSGAERQLRSRRVGKGGRRQRRDAGQRRARQAQLAAHLRRPARQAAAAAHDGDARQHRPHPARPRHQRHRAGRGADRAHRRPRRRRSSRRCACTPISPTPSSSCENVAWRKPPGRAATLQFDIAKGKTHKTELQNFKVAGDDIAIEGWAAIDADNRMREFYFPDFSLNVVSRLEVQGTLGKRRHLEGEGARADLRRARLLPLAVLARPARRERAQAARSRARASISRPRSTP